MARVRRGYRGSSSSNARATAASNCALGWPATLRSVGVSPPLSLNPVATLLVNRHPDNRPLIVTGRVARERPRAQRGQVRRAELFESRVGGLFDWRKVVFRECASGPGLQVTLEARGRRAVGELHDDEDTPRAMINSLPRWSLIVPSKSFVNVRGAADIVARRIASTSEDVNEPLTGAFHEEGSGMSRANE